MSCECLPPSPFFSLFDCRLLDFIAAAEAWEALHALMASWATLRPNGLLPQVLQVGKIDGRQVLMRLRVFDGYSTYCTRIGIECILNIRILD